MTSLVQASRTNDLELLKDILASPEEELDKQVLHEKDALGWTAMHHAAFNNHTEAIQMLRNRGFDVNYQTLIEQFTPLFIATANGNTEAAVLLLQLGADPNISDLNGRLPLDIALKDTALKDILTEKFNAESRIKRLLPAMRKLLANSIFQAILRVFIAVFLEIFKDNLYSALSRSLQLFVMVHPRISAILYRLFSFCIIPFTPVFQTVYSVFMPIITPFISLFVSFLRLPLFIWVWQIGREIFMALFSVIFSLLSIPLGIIYSLLATFSTVFKTIALTLLRMLFPLFRFFGMFLWRVISAFNFVQIILNKLQSLIPILYGFVFRFFQPLQLAGNLVIPIARLVSKLLPLFPRRLIDWSLRVAKKIGGENRFVSDEELAILNLITILSTLYVFCFIIGGYLIRLTFVLCKFYEFYDFLDIVYPFSPEEMIISWGFDSQLHEIGLIFFLVFTLMNVFLYVIWRILSFFFGRVRHMVASPRNSGDVALRLSGERAVPESPPLASSIRISDEAASSLRLSVHFSEPVADPWSKRSGGLRNRSRSFTTSSVCSEERIQVLERLSLEENDVPTKVDRLRDSLHALQQRPPDSSPSLSRSRSCSVSDGEIELSSAPANVKF